MTISIVGTGYVGLTTGAILAAAGHKVYCIDVDKKKIDIIKSGKSHFYEAGLDELVRKGIESKNLIPTLSYEEAIPKSSIAMICVGTPSKGDGSVDLTYVFDSAKAIAQHMKSGMVIVQKSTVPVGTGRRLERLLSKDNGKKTFDIVSCPEFLAEGSAVFDSFNMDRLVVGSDSEKAKKKIIDLFKTVDTLAKKTDLSALQDFAGTYKKKVKMFTDTPFKERVVSVGLESAELIKVTANAFLTTKISFANSIARICDKVNADINEVMDGVGLDGRIGRAFLYAGLGWGGGCFPKDDAGLIHFAEEVGFDFKILKSVVDINSSQILYVMRKVQKILGQDLDGKTITVLGLTFKPGTSDIRISPSIKLVNNLLRNQAMVKVYDPEGLENAKPEIESGVYFARDTEDALKGTELAILATEWPEFVNIDFKKVKKHFKKPNLIDGRNKWDKELVTSLGYTYQGIGR